MITRVFRNGNSQAVRIPQAFRLETSEVEITRGDHGDLVIRPRVASRGQALLAALAAFDDDLAAELAQRVEADRRDQPPVQEREGL